MFLIDAIKPNVEKKFKMCFIFYATARGEESIAYKINPISFLFGLSLLAGTKKLTKRNEK